MNEEDLQRYLAGEMDEEERRSFQRELLGSEQGMLDAYDELAIREALALRQSRLRRPRASRRAARPRWLWPTAGAAVAILALVLLWPSAPDRPTFRGGDHGALQLLAPRDTLSSPPSLFRWTAHPRAAVYRLEIFDDQGRAWFRSATTDTFARPSEEPPTAGSWRVTAIDSVGLVLRTSGRVEFRTR